MAARNNRNRNKHSTRTQNEEPNEQTTRGQETKQNIQTIRQQEAKQDKQDKQLGRDPRTLRVELTLERPQTLVSMVSLVPTNLQIIKGELTTTLSSRNLRAGRSMDY